MSILFNQHTIGVATRSEAEAFLAANPEIAFIDILYNPMSGPPRGKRIRPHELLAVYGHGRYLPGSITVVDMTGADCEATGLVWEDGDADRLAKPAPNTLFKAPWLGEDVAQCVLSLYELDGAKNELDPRHVLQRVLNRFAADGLTPDVACELEFYLCDQRFEGQPASLPLSPVTGHKPIGHEVYGLRELDDYMPYLRDLYAAAAAQDLPIEAAISEFAPGQLEIGLAHRADALRVADEAVMFKRLVKGCAVAHGMEATFMAKPFEGRAGNGQHLHVSVLNKAGHNIFASEDPQGTPALRHAIAGMQQLLPAGMAIFAPNQNSYRRFVGNSYAPVAATWGVNNRTVGLRVTAGPPESRHVEHRVCGADANPYLALATMLAGVHYGLTHQLDPSPAITGDGYAQAHKAPVALAKNWFNAVDTFAASEVIKDYLGARFQAMFTTLKRTEQDRYFAHVPIVDYEWCFRNA
ncbi:glutamine synthetase family protein [Candidatus Phycosocius spiralis]|uniref:Glutamine synthetase n=1 Tax=Candidatus Phycosocius spiralis TaxID=2815099 RepID=A0ABQ4PVV4_9PROT|nr:glutamine synthetase family protein [Candidatus Phycosocius spiralis]GIU66798.1 glutamine synthetase [Candidatus Phycosocius spiralis]